jgi:hypothetical protein
MMACRGQLRRETSRNASNIQRPFLREVDQYNVGVTIKLVRYLVKEQVIEFFQGFDPNTQHVY